MSCSSHPSWTANKVRHFKGGGVTKLTKGLWVFGWIAKQIRLMDWWCLSVRSSVRPSVCPSTFWLTSGFKFVLCHINQYRLETLHGNRPWWDLLNCDLSLWPWPWLFCSRSLNNFGYPLRLSAFSVALISTDLIPCMGINLGEIYWTATFHCDPDLHFLCPCHKIARGHFVFALSVIPSFCPIKVL